MGNKGRRCQFVNLLLASLCCILLIASSAQGENTVDANSDITKLAPLDNRPNSPVITAIAVSPDNRWIAAAGDDHAIRLIDISSLLPLATLFGHKDWVQSIDFAPNGESLVSCGNDRALWIWEKKTNWSGRQLTLADVALSAVKFHPRGDEIVYAGFGPKIQFWSLGQSRVVRSYECDCNDQRAVAYSKDGSKLACGGRDGKLRVWDSQNGTSLCETQLHQDRIRSISFSSDTIVTTIGQDRHIIRYDLLAAKKVLDTELAGTKLTAMTPIGDHMVAIAGSDNSIRLFCTNEAVEKLRLEGHSGTVAVLVRAGNRLISSGYDTELRIWDIDHYLELARSPTKSNSLTDQVLPKSVVPISIR